MKYTVRVARDCTEYADVSVEADSLDEAEEKAEEKDNEPLEELSWYFG